MARREKLFGLTNFGSLKMADFKGDFIERRGKHGQGGDVGGVAIALKHLGRDQGGLQS